MSRFNDGLTAEQMGSSDSGIALLERKQRLDTYGTDDGGYERTPCAAVSVVYFQKGETITRKEFFREKNKVSSLPNVEFPLKTSAMDVLSIRVDVDVNFSDTKQASLEKEYHFLKDSVVRTTVRKVEGLEIPLEHCVPYVIEFDGENFTKKMVRNGYNLPAPVKLGSIDEFQIVIEPAPGYAADVTAGNVDPAGPNSIRIGLLGTTQRVRYNS